MTKGTTNAILVADDDRVTLKVFQGIFRRTPYKVYFAKNGVEAIAKAKKSNIDLAFIDILMPEMDGFETMLEWKKMQPQTNIIIMSTYNDDETIRRAIKEGAYTYMFKPVNRIDVFSIVSKCMKNQNVNKMISF